MTYSIEEVLDSQGYAPLTVRQDAPFTQQWFYGEWQEKMDRKVFRFKILKNAVPIGFFQAVTYPLLFGKSYLYIPHGPVIAEPIAGDLAKVLEERLSLVALREDVVFVRVDPFPKQELPGGFSSAALATYYGAYFQSKYDWVLDISPDPKQLLAGMHQKTRYSINYTFRQELELFEVSGAELINHFESFYALMQETAKRGKFALHPRRYYEAICMSAKENPDIVLFIARFQGRILAMHLMIFAGAVAYYPFGASTREHSNLLASYALHWRAILEGKKRGCRWYNFGAVEEGALTHDHWQGISIFKRKFGGQLMEYSDFYDVVTGRFWYMLYVLRKKMKR